MSDSKNTTRLLVSTQEKPFMIRVGAKTTNEFVVSGWKYAKDSNPQARTVFVIVDRGRCPDVARALSRGYLKQIQNTDLIGLNPGQVAIVEKETLTYMDPTPRQVPAYITPDWLRVNFPEFYVPPKKSSGPPPVKSKAALAGAMKSVKRDDDADDDDED